MASQRHFQGVKKSPGGRVRRLELDGEVVKRLCLKRIFFFGLNTEKLNAMLVWFLLYFPFLS